MKKTDRAWVAGLVNGEGCISGSLKGTIHIQITMCDVWCLNHVLYLVPGSHLGPWVSRSGTTAFRRWHVTGRKALDLLGEIEPWLSPVKTADWEYALKRAPNAGKGNYAVRVIGKRPHCIRGHIYDAENTYWYTGPHGKQRLCKRCRGDANKRWYDTHKDTKFWLKYRSNPQRPRF